MNKLFLTALLIVISGQTIASEVASTGLVAHYKFENNANDSSVNANHGVEHGAVSYIDGVIGQSGSFDGVDDFLQTSNVLPFNGSSQYTVSGWFKTTNGGVILDTTRDGVGSSRSAGFSMNISTNTGNFHAGISSDGIDNRMGVYVGSIDYRDGVWHHYSVTYDGGLINTGVGINIDGIKKIVKPIAGIYIEDRISLTGSEWSEAIQIGRVHHLNATLYFSGDLDDLKIYNRVLSDSEIQELYNEGSTPNTEESASYKPVTGALHLPRVEVGMEQYSAKLKLTNALNFKLVEAAPIESAGLNNASFAGSLLKIPMVKVPNEAGFDDYNANLTLIPDTNPIEFKLNNADLISSDYSEHAVSVASAVIESYMKNAKDTIVSFRVEGGAIKYSLFRYKAATQELVNGSIQVLASGAFASMETYTGCKKDVTSLECVKTVEKILASTLTGLGAGIVCSPAGPYAAVACSSTASILTKLALDKAYELAFDAGIFVHKVVVVVNEQAAEIYDFGVSIYKSDIGRYLDWVAICLADIRRNCKY